MNKQDVLKRIKIPSIKTSEGYSIITANSRQGGSYNSNYSKRIPMIMLGTVDTDRSVVEVTCEQVFEGDMIEFFGYLKNEYLLENIEMSYSYGSEEGPIDKEPYLPWSFKLPADLLYINNADKVFITVKGINSEEKEVIIESYAEVIYPGDCLQCDPYFTESAFNAHQALTNSTFDVIINGVQLGSDCSLEELIDILKQEGISTTVYQELT